MSVKLLTEQHLEYLSLKGGCTVASESTLVKMPHCWKAHLAAQLKNTDHVRYVCSVLAESYYLLSKHIFFPKK